MATKQATKQATPTQAPATMPLHPTGKVQAGAQTYKGATLAQYQQAGRFTYATKLACGTPVTIAHVVRRRYVVFNAKGVAIGYVTASMANGHTNAINRVNGNTLATLRLH